MHQRFDSRIYICLYVQVLRRLRQQGEMSELRDDEGPGGDALPDTVRFGVW